MKYNDKLVICENDSHSILLGKISKNSKVLEFGCANGMMTQYMKEELGCQVYIVEYEKEAYDDAIQYAVDGVCSDIMQLEWYDKFQFKFDYILFADVLEHLIDPKLILQKTKDKLEDEGEVLISVPNIAHNDIVLKLMDDHFDYTSIGILDDTHIHFFARNNIEEFVFGTGYEIAELEYVTKPTFQTEQYYGERIPLDNYLLNMLHEREYGEVYQFIIRLKKKTERGEIETTNAFNRKTSSILGKIYFDRGDGYTEEEAISVEADFISSRRYRCICQITDLDQVKEIRYDPIERQGCMITKCIIKQGCNELEVCYSPSFQAGEGVILFDKDPMIRVLVQNREQSIEMEVEFVILGQEYMEELTQSCMKYYRTMLTLQEKVETDMQLNNRHIEEKNIYIAQQQKQLEEKDSHIVQQQKRIEEKNTYIVQQQRKLEEKESYIIQRQKNYEETLKNKEKIIQSLSDNIYSSMMILQEKIELDIQIKNRKMEEQNDCIIQQQRQIEELNKEVSQTKAAYEHILQTKSWKYTGVFRKIGGYFKMKKNE